MKAIGHADNFLAQVIKEATDGECPVESDSCKDLVRNVKLSGRITCSNHEMVESGITEERKKSNSRIVTLYFRKSGNIRTV